MSKKQRRVSMLIQIKNSIDSIGGDAKNQTPESIKKNMNILSESIIEVLAIDDIRAMPMDGKVGCGD